MKPMMILSHTLALVLEAALLVLLGLWGFNLVAGPWLNWLAMLVVLSAAIGLWGWLAAPKSTRRLHMPWLFLFKIFMFSAGTLAALGIYQLMWALVFGGLAIVHLGLAWVTRSV